MTRPRCQACGQPLPRRAAARRLGAAWPAGARAPLRAAVPADALARIVAELPPPRTAAAARIWLVASGLRPSEVMAIRPEDWRRDAGELLVRHGDKGQPAGRVVTLTPSAVAALETLEELGAWGRFFPGALRDKLDAAKRAAGLGTLDLRLHDLRGAVAGRRA